MMETSPNLRETILDLVSDYFDQHHQTRAFEPGVSKLHYAGRVYDATEMKLATEAVLEFWLTQGRYTRKFERQLAAYLGVEHCLLVNSGSSANLLAFMALTSPLLKERRIERGDEVITVAACFPTTIAPMVQYGAVPVFVDIEAETLNINIGQLEAALSPKTKAVMIAHTLGNPFDVVAVKAFCDAHQLWLIEDNCDALGSTVNGQLTGTFGDIGTSSFYPPHHITMGEGGAVYTSNPLLNKILGSMRDWGRDCWCESGRDNTCQKRFEYELGSLPKGYDHKYIYSHFGYNLKATDIQAAIGIAQLEKLPGFVEKRRAHFAYLNAHLADLGEFFTPSRPIVGANPSWFGYHMTLRPDLPFSRTVFSQYLESHKIQTRLLFSGNVIRHPCFDILEAGRDYRVVGALDVTEQVMSRGIWLGVFPGLTEESLGYMVKIIREAFTSSCQG